MLKDFITLVQQKPVHAVIAVLLTVIAVLVTLGYKDMTSRSAELKTDFQRLELKVDAVDNKVDLIDVQVRSGGTNDSLVIREILRITDRVNSLETRIRHLENEQ
jgi:hypothetical protein